MTRVAATACNPVPFLALPSSSMIRESREVRPTPYPVSAAVRGDDDVEDADGDDNGRYECSRRRHRRPSRHTRPCRCYTTIIHPCLENERMI